MSAFSTSLLSPMKAAGRFHGLMAVIDGDDNWTPAGNANAHQVRVLPAGREIYGQGETVRNLYKVDFGGVRVYRLLADGRRQISAFYLSGETFGFEAGSDHHFFAEAIVRTRIRTIPHPENSEMTQQLLAIVLSSLARAQEHLLVLGRQTAVERLAAFLLDLATRQGRRHLLDLPMPRSDIADYLGLTVETVSRVFSRLRASGAIRLPASRSVEIVSWNALRSMSE